jgi:hypothetical protein
MDYANYIPVESSNIAAVGFDAREDDETVGTLYVRFKNGGEFAYYDVPAEKYDAFLDAESKGKFYIANVKSAYACDCTKKAEQTTKDRKRVKPKNAGASMPRNEGTIDQPPLMRTGGIDL